MGTGLGDGTHFPHFTLIFPHINDFYLRHSKAFHLVKGETFKELGILYLHIFCDLYYFREVAILDIFYKVLTGKN